MVQVATDDLEAHFIKNEHQAFLDNILTNTKRYVKLFSEAADEIEITRTTIKGETEEFDETLNNFRLASLDSKQSTNPTGKPPKEILNLLKRKL